MLSVIVPIYNEEAALPAFLAMVDAWDHPCETVFVDGGSTDGTLSLLGERTVLVGPKGRGEQCRLGIAATGGDHLLFLHVDTILDEGALAHIDQALDAGVKWGCLTIDFTSHSPEYRFGIRKSNWRARRVGIAFGDQGMFMTREALAAAGGMPDACIMEDYELSRRLRRAYGKPAVLPDRITASVRRFEAGNHTLIGFKMSGLRLLYRLGVPPERIQGLYGDVREGDGGSAGEGVATKRAGIMREAGGTRRRGHGEREDGEASEDAEARVLILFTRVPTPGKTKTRLSPALSPEDCAEAQRALLADAVQALSALDCDVTVCYAPDHEGRPDAAGLFDRFTAILGACYRHPTRRLRLARQRGGGLGERMDAAFADAFAQGAARCLLMGSDVVGVTATDLEEAFRQLDDADVVLGPAEDGGYWLVGLKRPFPELFAGKRYGGSGAYADARAACAGHGRSVAEGPRKHDVDTPEDLREAWRIA